METQQQKYVNLRVKRQDLELLKIVAALSRESMMQAFRRLVLQEYGRMHQQQEKENNVNG